MTWFVRGCALYNLGGAASFLVPGALGALGVALPSSAFWVWLPALMGLFAAAVLVLSAADLRTYGSFPYWNGLVRLLFVAVTFALDFAGSAGDFVWWLALGDLPLALVCLLGLPAALGRSHLSLLTNRR